MLGDTLSRPGYLVPWAKPEHQAQAINQAGKVLASGQGDLDAALNVVNNWRACHSFPLNIFQLGLRHRGPKNALVAQRLKRVSSMVAKLQREPDMRLSQMQDIGGCRAVLDSIAAVHRLRDSYLTSRIKHKLVKQKDYIAEPKDSGYRSIHLVYRYFSNRNSTWNDMKIEIQLRSRLQHAWATAVETVGTLLGEALKASEGSQEWLTFLTLTSSAFALLEKTAPVPGCPVASDELKAVIRGLALRLKVETTLLGYKMALQMAEGPKFSKAHYFLLALDHNAQRLRVRGFRQREIAQATDETLQEEKRLEGIGSVVLVSVGSMDQLKRAYPNYYQDTDLFLQHLRQVIA